MNSISYTQKEIDLFLDKTDFDLVTELHEEMMIPEDITFVEFFRRYNKKHLAKYGCKLTMKLE